MFEKNSGDVLRSPDDLVTPFKNYRFLPLCQAICLFGDIRKYYNYGSLCELFLT
jgi:hypothetical protein